MHTAEAKSKRDASRSLKVVAGKEIRRVRVDPPFGFLQLEQLIGSMEDGASPYRYIDDEGDECIVSCDATLTEAFVNHPTELKLFCGTAEAKSKRDASQQTDAETTVAGISVRAVTMFIVLTKDLSKWSDIIVGAVRLGIFYVMFRSHTLPVVACYAGESMRRLCQANVSCRIQCPNSAACLQPVL